jgi:hypothetical protein
MDPAERRIAKNIFKAARQRYQGMADLLKEILKDLEKETKVQDDNSR